MTTRKGASPQSGSVTEKQFESLVQAATDAILGIDHQGKITIWNKAATKMFGYSVKQAIGMDLHNLIVPDRMHTKAREGFNNFVKTGKGPLIGKTTECVALRKDGSEFPVELSISGFKHVGHWHATGIIRDITRRKQTDKWDNILTNISPAAIYLFDDKMNFVYSNPAGEKLLGYTREELLSKNIPEVDADPEVVKSAHEKLSHGEGIQYFEHKLRRKDGGIITVSNNSVTIKDSNGKITNWCSFLVDITKLKQAEEQLRRFERIVSTSTDMMALLDKNFIYLAANSAYLDAFNKSPGELVGHSVPEIFGEEFFNEVIKTRAERCLAGETVNYRTWVDFPAYGARYMDTNYCPYTGADNKISGFVVNGRDITAYYQSEAKFQTVFHNSNDAIFIHDLNGSILDVNNKTLEMFGYSLPEIQALKITDLHPKESLPEAKRAFEVISKDKSAFFKIDFRKKNGNIFPAEVSSKIFEFGEKQYIHGSVRDITDRKRIEQSLIYSQKHTKQIIETARDAFIGMDEAGNIIDWNPQAEALFGWSSKEILGKAVGETIVPLASRKAHKQGLKHYLASGESSILNQMIETTAQHHDGHTFPVELSIVPMHENGTRTFNAFVRDISERYKSQQQLKSSLVGTIVAISRAVGSRDPYTEGHQQRVAHLARCIAQEMGLDSAWIDGLRMGATIHDIGKIYLPAEILSKPVKLTDTEFALIKTHCQVGYDILKDIEFPWPIADIAHQHHERLDGTGYPQGLKGDEICLEAKIVAVADVVEAISSHRPYRAALGIDVALQEIEKHRGEWYEPAAVDACLNLFRKNDFSFE